MTVNSSANSIILILFAFSDNLSAENSKLSAESGLCGLSLLGSMPKLPIFYTCSVFGLNVQVSRGKITNEKGCFDEASEEFTPCLPIFYTCSVFGLNLQVSGEKLP